MVNPEINRVGGERGNDVSKSKTGTCGTDVFRNNTKGIRKGRRRKKKDLVKEDVNISESIAIQRGGLTSGEWLKRQRPRHTASFITRNCPRQLR